METWPLPVLHQRGQVPFTTSSRKKENLENVIPPSPLCTQISKTVRTTSVFGKHEPYQVPRALGPWQGVGQRPTKNPVAVYLETVSKVAAEIFFEVVPRAYERSSLMASTHLLFEKWAALMGNEPITGALLHRPTPQGHYGPRRELPP